MVISNANSHSPSMCEGFECFKEAIFTITERVNNIDITFQLCETCISNHWVNSTSGLTKTKKKELEQQVVRPECSNLRARISRSNSMRSLSDG
jgi:protein-arginine kinase activator protein McsA